ncbi:MAG: 16S rRNA (cytidine(1402)-2'-O)-methyltransferase [Verrucomicrobia bacterium]|nr:16S rRNA (cytidine(1402)-2'-O)-methyltransferase [Verrucomicrobiota bacterium]MDA1203588.1 16S rRNA (cytidine(1402)-2'-O)-methyltransferase [Verrucomicrobiota bacterium]
MLTFVPSPVGNLEDITLRALRLLREADLIAAEDTRHASILLKHHGISRPLLSLHEHNEAQRSGEIAQRLAAGENIALLTDAGMPGISDPGYRMVRACLERGLEFTVLPGPSSILPALVGSGLPLHEFYFGGFLPVKSGRRKAALEAALARGETSIFFESPHRIARSLAVLAELAPERPVCVARELSKKFEEYWRGSAAELSARAEKQPPRGEICLLIAGQQR